MLKALGRTHLISTRVLRRLAGKRAFVAGLRPQTCALFAERMAALAETESREGLREAEAHNGTHRGILGLED